MAKEEKKVTWPRWVDHPTKKDPRGDWPLRVLVTEAECNELFGEKKSDKKSKLDKSDGWQA